eukprot:scaffold32979_cov29-Prasinocladus_malaysianus.AAC.1
MANGKQNRLAGVIGGVVASTTAALLTFPLVASQISQQVGSNAPFTSPHNGLETAALWSGLIWALGSALAGYSVYFSSFEMVFTASNDNGSEISGLQRFIKPRWAHMSLLTRTLLSSAVATIVNTPFEILKTRSIAGKGSQNAMEGRQGAASFIISVSAALDWSSLISGFVGNTSGLLGTAIQFTIYHSLLPRLSKNVEPGSALHAARSANIGVFASGVATTLTFPLDTLKSVVMSADAGDVSFYEAAAGILADRGAPGFFSGLTPALLRNAATAFVTFLLLPVCTTVTSRLLRTKQE